MDSIVYESNGKEKKTKVDYDGLKKAHKDVLQDVIETFKT
tara:strand:- start:1092 stop:1211 length:120 start_codon:yes stop_codon:yes gene_type:complete